jgi:Zn-dependent protease
MELFSLTGVIQIVILVYSAILHEIAHGYVAYRLGDPTAKLRGRLTLNPRSHIDPYMTILIPLLLIFSGSPIIFGGAKPVPVDPFNLRDGIKDLSLVSLAGPLTNVGLAILGSLALHIFYPGFGIFDAMRGDIFSSILASIVQINLFLAVFNLVPIPPLDGSKVFSLLLPPKQAAAYMSLSSVGMIFLMFLLFFPIGGFSLMSVIANLVYAFISLLGL